MGLLRKIFLLLFISHITLFAVALQLTQEEQQWLKEHPTLRVQNLTTFPPFNFNENGKAKGFTIEYMKLLGNKLGVEIEFISGKPWPAYLTMLKEKQLDIIPHIAITQERKAFVEYTDFIHIEYVSGLAIRKGTKLSSLEDLDHKVIAVARKTFLHTYLKNNYPHISLLLTTSTQKAVEAVSTGKADAVIGSLPSLHYFMQKAWLSNLTITSIKDFKLPEATKLPMGVAKNNKILKSILEKVNASISQEEISELKSQWMNAAPDITNKFVLSQEERSYLQSKGSINMCIDPDWMPFEKNANGKHIGMSADYFELFQKTVQIPIKMVPTTTWLESLELGKKRECDIFSLVMPTPERRKYLEFTQPYLNVPLVIATNIEKPFINDITTVLDKKVGLVKGYAYGELLRIKYPNMNVIEVNNVQEGLNRVRDNELYGFIGTLSTVGYNIQKNYIGELKIAGKFDDQWSLGVGVRNDEPILKDIFNKAIHTITPQEHQDILSKWVSVNYQKGVDHTIILQVTLFFLVIVGFMSYRTQTIKKLNKKMVQQQELVDKYVLILKTDLDGVITDVNSAYCKATGYSKKELIGNTHAVMRHPEMTDAFFNKMWKSIENNQSWFGEIKNFKKDKEPMICNVFIEPVFEHHKKVGYISISEDITDKKRIEKISITDKLTGLFNRHKLDEILTMKIEEYLRYKTPFSVILLDIDYFKDVNDNYGHDIGDYVLQQFATLLKSSVRTTDTVGRWGGEEFIIVCTNTTIENATTLAEHLRVKIESTPFDTVGNKTASFGVTEFKKGDDMISFFKSVDDALYQAKQTGRNKVIAN